MNSARVTTRTIASGLAVALILQATAAALAGPPRNRITRKAPIPVPSRRRSALVSAAACSLALATLGSPAIGGYQLVPVRDSLVAPYLVDASTGQGWRYEAGLLSRAWDARTAPADRSPERCSVRSTRKEAAW